MKTRNFNAGVLVAHLVLHTCSSSREPVSLDTKSKLPSDDIEKTVKFRKWTTFRIRDPERKRIGDINHGSIRVLDDMEDATERTVYFKPLKRSSERYLIKVVTYARGIQHTVEFTVNDGELEKTCAKIIRDPIDVNIRSIDRSAVKSSFYRNGWIEYSIRNELTLQYRMGSISDGGIEIVQDSRNENVRLRYVHVTNKDLIEILIQMCLPFLPPRNPTIVRVFTYYYEGERSFDEFVKSCLGGREEYTELVRKPVALNLAKRDPRLFKKYKIDRETFVFNISDSYKNKNKIGEVTNNELLIARDDENSRLRSVYVNRYDSGFESVEVKTCPKRGDCRRCKYTLEDGQYSESSCQSAKEGTRDPGSIDNLTNSNEDLGDDAPRKGASHLRRVVSFGGAQDPSTDVSVDISHTESDHFSVDVLPNYGGLYYSLTKEMAGRDQYLNILDGGSLVARTHLESTQTVEFMVKQEEDGRKRLFMWIKCGPESGEGHEIVVIDPLKKIAEYSSNKMENKEDEPIITMIN